MITIASVVLIQRFIARHLSYTHARGVSLFIHSRCQRRGEDATLRLTCLLNSADDRRLRIGHDRRFKHEGVASGSVHSRRPLRRRCSTAALLRTTRVSIGGLVPLFVHCLSTNWYLDKCRRHRVVSDPIRSKEMPPNRVASSGRRVAQPWPRRMACLQRLAGTDPVSLRSCSVQRARGRPGRKQVYEAQLKKY